MRLKTHLNETLDLKLPKALENRDLLALPALIDPHVHFRVPGHGDKEDWPSGARAAMAGGVTTVFDMPNNIPPVVDQRSLEHKRKIVEEQLRQCGIPLRHYFYFGVTKNNSREFEKVKPQAVGLKMFMGSSTGSLLVGDPKDQEKIFQAVAELDMLLAVHAEDEAEIQRNKSEIKDPRVEDHSKIRSREAAVKAVKQALAWAKKYGARVYFCHISTKEEVELIKEAKEEGLTVYAEVTPHHLFLNEGAYASLGALAQVNPPLRAQADNQALWQAITDGVIDTIGSDHAPHTLFDKAKPYPLSPSGVPGIETTLPLLLNACHEGRITLQKIVELTRTNAEKIFRIPSNNDWVVVDPTLKKAVENKNLKTKCAWSPYVGMVLQGWPVGVVVDGRWYSEYNQM